LDFVPPKPPISGRNCKISLDGKEIIPIGSWSIGDAQIPDSEVEIQTQFPLNLNDIVSLNGEEYRCIRVRWSEGEPYTITLRRVGIDISFTGTWSSEITNNEREEVIDNMTPKIRHEHNRFAEMTERQLWTRLGKITTLEKLGNFAYMAERFNKPDLAIAARARLDRLGGKPYREIIRSHIAKDTSLSNGDGERLLRKLDTI